VCRRKADDLAEFGNGAREIALIDRGHAAVEGRYACIDCFLGIHLRHGIAHYANCALRS
jgi:hypothetical protein